MLNNHSIGALGATNGFNFKSGDPSGTAAKMSGEKMGQGAEYFNTQGNEESEDEFRNEPYVDKSAQLSATLNSLAMINVAGILKSLKKLQNKKKINADAFLVEDNETETLSSDETVEKLEDTLKNS